MGDGPRVDRAWRAFSTLATRPRTADEVKILPVTLELSAQLIRTPTEVLGRVWSRKSFPPTRIDRQSVHD